MKKIIPFFGLLLLLVGCDETSFVLKDKEDMEYMFTPTGSTSIYYLTKEYDSQNALMLMDEAGNRYIVVCYALPQYRVYKVCEKPPFSSFASWNDQPAPVAMEKNE